MQIDDAALIRIIHQTIREARHAGLDLLGQEQKAALAVIRARPEIPSSDARVVVQRVLNAGYCS